MENINHKLTMKISFNDVEFTVRSIAQYQTIPHNKSLTCNCGYGDYTKPNSINLKGYLNTHKGYMVCCECKKCHEVYSHHITWAKFNLEEFKLVLGMILYKLKNSNNFN
jgi:hypothetical protein